MDCSVSSINFAASPQTWARVGTGRKSFGVGAHSKKEAGRAPSHQLTEAGAGEDQTVEEETFESGGP